MTKLEFTDEARKELERQFSQDENKVYSDLLTQYYLTLKNPKSSKRNIEWTDYEI